MHAAAVYGEAVRAVLIAHKERGATGLAGPLGRALAGAVRAGLPRPDPDTGRPGPGGVAEGLVLVPVPSARRAVAARGHDATRRIALAAASDLRRSGLPARVLPVLRQNRPVADQAELTGPERLTNVSGALGVRRGAEALWAGAAVVLVDDLITTGASLAEAARALSAAQAAGSSRSPGPGFARLSAAVVAHSEPFSK